MYSGISILNIVNSTLESVQIDDSRGWYNSIPLCKDRGSIYIVFVRNKVRVDADYVIAGTNLCEAPSSISVLMLKQKSCCNGTQASYVSSSFPKSLGMRQRAIYMCMHVCMATMNRKYEE